MRIQRKAARLLRSAALLLCCCTAAACGGSFGNSNLTPGSTPNIAGQTALRVVGTPGTPFKMSISDTVASWVVRGVTPMTVVIINNHPPVRAIASKLTASNSLMSVEAISGFYVVGLSSTSEPFGTAVLAVGGTLNAFAPPPSPDFRFLVNGPRSGLFDGLIEDQQHSYQIEQRARALFLFERPQGRIDGQFNTKNTTGVLTVDLLKDGVVVRSGSGENNVTLKYP